jgi:DNA-binding NarL/FixJ family response regulator
VIRVAIPDESPALRAGLRALLLSDDDIQVIEEVNEADVIITSASLTSFHNEGMDAPISASILFLRDDPINDREAMRSQFPWGVLPLDASADELCASIHALSQGLIVGERSLLFPAGEVLPSNSPLTDRETEVLNLLSRGLANKQIAVRLSISEHTVKFHVSSIYQKLNVTNRTEAVREGLRGGWITL